MTKRNLIKFTTIFMACMLGISVMALRQLTGSWAPVEQVAQMSKLEPVRCAGTARSTRPPATDPQLKVVAEYEAVCDSAFFDTMMLFTNMPVTETQAAELADGLTERLKAFDAYGIRPIVVIEPDSPHELIDFHKYAQGWYDSWIDAYFANLKANGVTDEQLGIWMPFPEPQIDSWSNNENPDDFARSFNRHVTILRKYFPSAKTAILLDSQILQAHVPQLVAYTRLIQPNLVDVAGLQGFPWHPGDDEDTRRPVTSARQFAPASALKQVAESLGVREVLVNTGSYGHRLVGTGGDVVITAGERQTTLDSIVHEAALLQKSGYSVTVNIFAENKLEVAEGIDWSYWSPDVIDDTSHAPLFTHFVKDLRDSSIAVSLFDSRP